MILCVCCFVDIVFSDVLCPLRAGTRLHRLPQSRSHDAPPPALGCLLLPHDHHAGAGHTGRLRPTFVAIYVP